MLRSSGRSSRFSGAVRLMQRPLLRQRRRPTAAVELEGLVGARKKTMRRGTRGKMERPPGPIYKGKKISVARKSRSLKFGYEAELSPRLSEAH